MIARSDFLLWQIVSGSGELENNLGAGTVLVLIGTLLAVLSTFFLIICTLKLVFRTLEENLPHQIQDPERLQDLQIINIHL